MATNLKRFLAVYSFATVGIVNKSWWHAVPYKLTRETHPINDVIYNTSQDAIDAMVAYIDDNVADCAADLLVIHPLPCWQYREFEPDYGFLVMIDKAPIDQRATVAKNCAIQKLWRDCRIEVIK